MSVGTVLVGLGTLAWGGTSGLLRGSLNISLSGEFFDSLTGQPLTLKERNVTKCHVRMRASFAVFSTAPVGAYPTTATFTHTSGRQYTVSNAILVKGEKRFTADGVALLSPEWEGDAFSS